MSILTEGQTSESGRPDAATALALADCQEPDEIQAIAAAIRDRGHGSVITYSPKVFIPLTQLCRDVCHYCTFAKVPDAKTRRPI